MKIVHISTYNSGGAGGAALRLHLSLLNSGIESKFLCLSLTENTPKTEKIKRGFFNKLATPLSKMKLYISKHYKNKELLRNKKGDYFYFSFPETDFNILKHKWVKDADIIHLHWVGNFLDYPSFFSKINKPVVWTFHDKNPVLGGFHLLLDIGKNKNNSIIELDKKVKTIKQKAIAKVKNMIIVTPSKALGEYSKNSSTFNRFTHKHIYNAIDTDIFKPANTIKAKSTLNLPTNKTVLLFLSNDISSFHKGTDIFLNILELHKTDYFYITVGPKRIHEDTDFHKYLGEAKKTEELCLMYSAADALLICSREDNLPNTMLEAMACGTPVIGTPIGGMLDVIDSNINGILSKAVSSDALIEAIRIFEQMKHKNIFNTLKIRQFAVDNFSQTKIANTYINLYNNLTVSHE